ncbi:aspartyl/asparaginyl beta-hydroxylase domain-containing protein [Brevundimonas sp. TWP2-3-4b1]|uniref:aspartyl/asparaginyl beta-hydroxylase domain-containing protein n=1 Tax=Brevundimonas sp. TWP2-3-4b1 TaxID=2804580 RepID=UPI003CF6DAF7
MQWLPSDRPILEAAMAAFRAGDWRSARARLEEATATGRADAGAHALLATALWNLHETDAALDAANRALQLDPRQLRALLVKAEALAAKGERREANAHFGLVEAAAAGHPSLAPDLVAGVARTRARREQLKSDLEGFVRSELADAGYREGRAPERFTHALEVLTGRRKLYVQQPRFLYYPGLPDVEFYPREATPWMDAVEDATDAVTAEVMNVIDEDKAFEPYVRSKDDMIIRAPSKLTDNMDWSSYYLWKDGRETENVARFRDTMAVMNAAPLCHVNGRSPLINFSQLKPGAHITPHTGVVNTRLLCHLPLVVPPNCVFRVGNQTRTWEKGKAWMFNDSIEHEAWNRSDSTRIVLIFDVWRPELDEEERRLISTLLQSMDAYAPPTGSWD